MADRLPAFGLDSYAEWIVKLRKASYQFRTINDMRKPIPGHVTYMRHDVDLHLSLILDMACLENALNVCATYFVPLTLHFNLLYPLNQSILQQIHALGHEIGLHYDLLTYPTDFTQAREHLDWEADILGKIVEAPVRTIAMHEPYKGHPDPFRMLNEYVHPHDPRYQKDLLYVSDSCRAWRDESLLQCVSSTPPHCLMLNTHPELWLDGTVTERLVYLDQVLVEQGIRQHREYFDQDVRQAWLNHSAPRFHDKRERQKGIGE